MILITGLTGTSGSAFYDVLCREKYSGKIRVVVRSTTNLEQFKNSPLDLEFVTGDITDVDFMAKAMDGCELVFNIAAKVHNKHVVDDLRSIGAHFVDSLEEVPIYELYACPL